MAELREEEFDFLIAKLAEFRAEDIMDADMVRISSVFSISYIRATIIEKGRSYDRYATERNGFWLKTSLSMNLFSRSHDIGPTRRWRYGGSERRGTMPLEISTSTGAA